VPQEALLMSGYRRSRRKSQYRKPSARHPSALCCCRKGGGTRGEVVFDYLEDA
jgi:hypothetical protein